MITPRYLAVQQLQEAYTRGEQAFWASIGPQKVTNQTLSWLIGDEQVLEFAHLTALRYVAFAVLDNVQWWHEARHGWEEQPAKTDAAE
jgi:hypothetical protein